MSLISLGWKYHWFISHFPWLKVSLISLGWNYQWFIYHFPWLKVSLIYLSIPLDESVIDLSLIYLGWKYQWFISHFPWLKESLICLSFPLDESVNNLSSKDSNVFSGTPYFHDLSIIRIIRLAHQDTFTLSMVKIDLVTMPSLEVYVTVWPGVTMSPCCHMTNCGADTTWLIRHSSCKLLPVWTYKWGPPTISTWNENINLHYIWKLKLIFKCIA